MLPCLQQRPIRGSGILSNPRSKAATNWQTQFPNNSTASQPTGLSVHRSQTTFPLDHFPGHHASVPDATQRTEQCVRSSGGHT
jgi:hypothetical protein